MRGNVLDMLPSGWDLAPLQSLAGVDTDLMLQREKDFFVCVDGTVYSKDFAIKAQAMRTVSLGPQASSLFTIMSIAKFDFTTTTARI